MEKESRVTTFGIKSYYDPYGDGKSRRKKFKVENFNSTMTMEKVKSKIEVYNANVGYYSQVDLVGLDGRKKEFKDFDSHYYSKS